MITRTSAQLNSNRVPAVKRGSIAVMIFFLILASVNKHLSRSEKLKNDSWAHQTFALAFFYIPTVCAIAHKFDFHVSFCFDKHGCYQKHVRLSHECLICFCFLFGFVCIATLKVNYEIGINVLGFPI